jgi:acetyl esterase/lipase
MKNIVILRVFAALLIVTWFGLNSSAQQPVSSDTIVYRITPTDTLKAYIFNPSIKGNRHPAVLLFHGGAWRIGDASWTFQRAKEFADNGMVAISIDYRLANNGLSPADAVDDACAAFAWVRNHAKQLHIDSRKVAGYGVSAGGHLVASAATLPVVKGKKLSAGERPDLLLLYSPALNVAEDKYFNALMKDKANAADYSPLQFITQKLPSTLIIQGEQDSIVFTVDAKAFRDKAIAERVNCSLFVYPHVGHLLTRNLKVQYKDFDSDPADAADAHKREDEFLKSNGYFK